MSSFEYVSAKKSLGQHFLTSGVIPKKMADAGEVYKHDVVVEIGPGTGVLTHELLRRGAKVLAIETDIRAEEALQKTFTKEIKSGQLTLIHKDARTLDFALLGLKDRSFKLISNIPYYLSGLLFRVSLSGNVQPKTLVFLVQKEVGKRITTSPKRGEKESLLSLSVKAYGEPEYVCMVSRSHFTPKPLVDSAVIAVRNISKKNFDVVSEDFFFKTLKLGFGSKRKQLLGNLSKRFTREVLMHSFSTCGIDLKTRAEDLPLAMWLKLTGSLSHHV